MIYLVISNAIIVILIFLAMLKFFDYRANERQLELLSVLTNAKDQYIVSHQDHVAVLASLFYEHLPKEIKRVINKRKLIRAAKLHDIGKIFIDDSILAKTGKLTDDEYEQIKTHAYIGARILNRTRHKDVAVFVNCHHERPDGLGYYKVLDTQIPIESKTISICDTFSALTTARCYRPAPYSIPEALKIIEDVAGSQLDEILVGYFLNIETKKLLAVDTMLKGQYFVL